MKNIKYKNNPNTSVLTFFVLFFLLGSSQGVSAQGDPLVIENDKVKVNTNLNVNGKLEAITLETKTITGNPDFTGNPNFSGVTTFRKTVKAEQIQLGNWIVKEENGQLVFTNGPQIMLLTPLAIGDKYGGGIVVHLNGDGHGLIAALEDQGKANWDQGMAMCNNYRGGGYNNWRLPNKRELGLMYRNLYKANMGEFSAEIYWTSEPFGILSWQQNFADGFQISNAKDNQFRVRAVRSF